MGARLPPEAGPGAIVDSFGIPQDPENLALAEARCYFCFCCATRPGAQNRPPNKPKIEPMGTQIGARLLQLHKR